MSATSLHGHLMKTSDTQLCRHTIHTHTEHHTRIHIYIYILCVRVYTHISRMCDVLCAYDVCMFVVRLFIMFLNVCVRACVRVYVCVSACLYICTNRYTCTHICTNRYTRTHAYANSQIDTYV